MTFRKYRWSKDYESAEEELERLLAAKQIVAERWSAEPGETFSPHTHPHPKQLWCAEGSLTLTINGKALSLQPGDALELPASTPHEGVAGINGCVCYEAPPTAENPTQLV